MRFEDGTVMQLYRQTIQEFGLYPGLTLTEEEMEKLKTAAGAMSAKMRAVRILSASSVSKRDLERRLIQKGEDPGQAKDAVSWLADMSLLDDEKTAEQIVQRCVAKGYGLQRAKQALYEKKIPKQYWDKALEDYPEQTEAITEFLKSRLGDEWDPKTLHKVMDALVRRGHSYGAIRRALNELSYDTEDFPEE